MGLFSQTTEYVPNRQCFRGHPYRIPYRHTPGRSSKITYPKPRQCPRCGCYRNDVVRKRGYFDPDYERW